MSKLLIRFYKSADVKEIKSNLLICGDLSAQCANCQAIDLKYDLKKCPKCETVFTYITFRNVRSHLPKMNKLLVSREGFQIIDFEDYQKGIAKSKAQNLFG